MNKEPMPYRMEKLSPEEAQILIRAILDYKPPTRWERFKNLLARVVIRLKR